MSSPTPKEQSLDEILEILKYFAEIDYPGEDGIAYIDDEDIDEAKTLLLDLIQREKVKAIVEELDQWADVAIDSKPTQYDFQNRIKELQNPKKSGAQLASEDKDEKVPE